MGCNCKKSSCRECSVEAEKVTVTKINFPGHPIIMIDDPSDLKQFNFNTGEGFNEWEGWSICDGQSHEDLDGNTIETPNLVDRFVVGAGGAYQVGDTGGANTVTLTEDEIPSHTHVVTDPGHGHTVNDPGHNHPVTDPGHTHDLTDPGHVHTLDIDAVADHVHGGVPDGNELVDNGGAGAHANDDPATFHDTDPAGGHTHTGDANSSTTGATVDEAQTGVSTQAAETNIAIAENETGITNGNTGGGEAHENRPPYYALIFIKKIYDAA